MQIPKSSQYLAPHLAVLEKGQAPNFDHVLRDLDAQAADVESLRQQAAAKVKRIKAKASQLGQEHKEAVQSTKREAEFALEQLKRLEIKVTSVSGKAIAMGQRLEKVDRQRRRAHEAEAAINKFEALRSADEAARSAALESILIDGSSLDTAAMLRKLDAIARCVRVQDSDRVLEGLAMLNERFEMSVIADFDQESEAWRATRSPDALDGMRRCAASLVCFNGGAACINRYITTRDMFMDEAILVSDEAAILSCHDPAAAADLIHRVLDDIRTLADQESDILPKIFPNPDKVLGPMLHRALEQRLARVLEGALAAVEDHAKRGGLGGGAEAWLEAVVRAYGLARAALPRLQEYDVGGDVDIEKVLLADVFGPARERFREENAAVLQRALQAALPAAAPGAGDR